MELSLLILRLRLAWVKLGIFNFFFSSLFRQLGLELCFVPKDTLLECFPIFCILSKLSMGWSLKLGVFTLLLDLDFFLLWCWCLVAFFLLFLELLAKFYKFEKFEGAVGGLWPLCFYLGPLLPLFVISELEKFIFWPLLITAQMLMKFIWSLDFFSEKSSFFSLLSFFRWSCFFLRRLYMLLSLCFRLAFLDFLDFELSDRDLEDLCLLFLDIDLFEECVLSYFSKFFKFLENCNSRFL